MERIEKQLSELGDLGLLAVVVALFCGLAVVVFAGDLRLRLALFGLAFAQTIARLIDLGAVASVATAAIAPIYVLVILSAIVMKRGSGGLNVWTASMVSSAFFAIFYVMSTNDVAIAMIIRTQWLLAVVAAILTAMTATSQQRLMQILQALCAGLGTGCVCSAIPLILNPMAAIGSYGRFEPYGSNPNQIGIAFALTAILAMYLSLQAKSFYTRIAYAAIATLGCGLLALTVSRMSMLICAVGYLALVPLMLRRPVYAVFIVLAICVGLVKLLGVAQGASYDRMNEGLDRSSWWERGYEQFAQRPYFGLLGSRGLSAIETEDNMHNAYLSILYLGGLSIGIPLFASQIRGLIAAWQIWLIRKRSHYDPVAITILATCSLMHVVHGFANEIIYYPMYTWSFLNVFCITFFITQAKTPSAIVAKPVANPVNRRTSQPPRKHLTVAARRVA